MATVNSESRHKRYRKHRAQRERNREALVESLKGKVTRGVIYLAFLAQGTLLKPDRNVHYRRSILSYYADMFDYGVDSLDQITKDKQYTILRYHLREDCVIERTGIVLPSFIINIWEIYTMLYDQLSVRLLSIKSLDERSMVLVQTVSIIITHRSIHFLLPHMLQNHEFMQKAPGQLLSFRLQYHVRFDDQNRIIYVNLEHQMAQAWMNLLQQPDLVKLVLHQMKPVDRAFIQTNYQQMVHDQNFLKNKTRS